jgi:thiol:disulfide interchange protein
MKKLLAALTVVLFAITPVQSHAETDAPQLYAVAFHADWCGSCKVLGPNVVKARGKADLDNQNVLFVKLDLTNKTTRHQSSLMAAALGISDFYTENNGKTGFVLLVNSATGETVGKLTKDMDAGQISMLIEEQIAAL